jgi:hypothetical protein
MQRLILLSLELLVMMMMRHGRSVIDQKRCRRLAEAVVAAAAAAAVVIAAACECNSQDNSSMLSPLARSDRGRKLMNGLLLSVRRR